MNNAPRQPEHPSQPPARDLYIKVSNLLKFQPHLTLHDNYHMTYEQWLGKKFSANQIGSFFITPPWDDQNTTINGIFYPGF